MICVFSLEAQLLMTERIQPYDPGRWPDRNSYLMYLRHLVVYEFAESMASNLRVLDLGCGVGYGSAVLIKRAKQVVSLDIDWRSLLTSPHLKHSANRLTADSVHLPFTTHSFDLVVSFQVIEHIQADLEYLYEIKRILKPQGRFIVSTPNRLLRLFPFQPPFNPYHVREYTSRSLKKVLTQLFSNVEVLGLKSTAEIMNLEKKRLRQNPLRVYLEVIADSVLPNSLAYNLKRLYQRRSRQILNKREDADALSTSWEARYSTKDYWIDSTEIAKSLDLIGLCQKH